MNKCLIISGGAYSPVKKSDAFDFIIACDHGYDHALKSDILPDLVVGDLDSCHDEPPSEISVMKLQCEKDDTDTMVAIRYAMESGYREIILTCALGNRLDHTIANMQAACHAAEQGIQISIREADTEIYFVNNSTVALCRKPGYSLSVLSASATSFGVSLSGTKYLLDNATLTNTFPIGISNEWISDTAEISVQNGTLMIILSRIP